LGRFRFSVLGVWRSLAVSRARIDAWLAEERKKSTPRPASPFACGIATKRWFFRRLTIRGRKHPRGKKNLLRNGPELKEALGYQHRSSPALGRMFVARPCGGLRHFRVLGRSGSHANRRLARRRNAAYALGPSPCQVVSQRCTKSVQRSRMSAFVKVIACALRRWCGKTAIPTTSQPHRREQ
jgi:hypothetical protein